MINVTYVNIKNSKAPVIFIPYLQIPCTCKFQYLAVLYLLFPVLALSITGLIPIIKQV